jgi:hypothetical protein
MRAAPVISGLTWLLAFSTAAAEEVRDIQRSGAGRAFVTVEANDAWEPDGFEKALIVRAAPIDKGPVIDGLADDPAWNGATELTVPLAWGGVPEATLKAVYTDKDVFLLVSWPDATRDDQHHPWLWDAAQERYIEGPQVEDSLLVSIEGGCDWNTSLLGNQVYDFDAWLWMAARTDPVGQAVDGDGSVLDRSIPNRGFVKYETRQPESAWNVKFVDRRDGILTEPWHGLKRMYKRAEAVDEIYVRYKPDGSPPPVFAERVEPPSDPAAAADGVAGRTAHKIAAVSLPTAPQYRPVPLSGDAGEVAAKGRWTDGRWTVEFRRALATPAGTSSDSVFERTTQFSIHVFDHTERVDEVSESGRLWLEFEPAANGEAIVGTTTPNP